MIGFVQGIVVGKKTFSVTRSARGDRVVRAMAAEEKKKEAPAKSANVATISSESTSDALEKLQGKITKFSESVQNIDVDDVQANVTAGTKKLLDNFVTGEWLKRGETYGAIQVALAFLLLRPEPALDGLVSFLVGPCLLLMGGFVCAKSIVDLGFGQVSIWPKPVDDGKLKTTGAYEYVRHPIYSGVLLSSLGFAASTGSPGKFALCAGLAYFFIRKIEVEEEYLKEEFGKDYASYSEEVPFKLIPKIF